MKMFLVDSITCTLSNMEGVSSRTKSLKGYAWNGIEKEALLGLCYDSGNSNRPTYVCNCTWTLNLHINFCRDLG